MRAPSAISPAARQAAIRRLDSADAANAAAFNAWDDCATLSFPQTDSERRAHADERRALADAWAATIAPLREARSKYFALVRARNLQRMANENRRLRKSDALYHRRQMLLARVIEPGTEEHREVFGDLQNGLRPFLNDQGDPVPIVRTTRERLDVLAEIEMIEADMELAKWRSGPGRSDYLFRPRATQRRMFR